MRSKGWQRIYLCDIPRRIANVPPSLGVLTHMMPLFEVSLMHDQQSPMCQAISSETKNHRNADENELPHYLTRSGSTGGKRKHLSLWGSVVGPHLFCATQILSRIDWLVDALGAPRGCREQTKNPPLRKLVRDAGFEPATSCV